VTSSPHYPQSNGRAEAAVKTVKRLYEKAIEDRQDPHLALLAWRNTPAEQSQLSPAQMIFGRRTRTNLPMTNELLRSPYDDTAHNALREAKNKQAAYYDRGARQRPRLSVGDTVRTRWDRKNPWEKAEVIKVLPHRSYQLKFENNTTRRRTSRHVRFSQEPPVIIRTDDQPIQLSPAATTTTTSNRAQQQQRQPPIVTRSGRSVKPPARFADYLP